MRRGCKLARNPPDPPITSISIWCEDALEVARASRPLVGVVVPGEPVHHAISGSEDPERAESGVPFGKVLDHLVTDRDRARIPAGKHVASRQAPRDRARKSRRSEARAQRFAGEGLDLAPALGRQARELSVLEDAQGTDLRQLPEHP